MNSFPLMLHKRNLITMYNCSKSARGLSVQLQEFRIFTKNSISLSLCWRQQDSRYAIHAGHQSNAKEFRYLRTVRVTAAVYWDFKFVPKHIVLTLQHWAGVSLYTSFLKLAETCVFIKQSLSPIQCQPFIKGYSLFRSYGVILPSSFNTIFSSVLIYSISLPVSVCSTVCQFKLFLER